MSGYEVGGMTHEQMMQIVQRRLYKLAMCKRGTVSSDTNAMLEKLGPKPAYTLEERGKITEGIAKRVQKALTPTATMMKEFLGDIKKIQEQTSKRAERVIESAYVHPKACVWEAEAKRIKQTGVERIATLDSDFQDAEDEFVLGVRKIQELPTVYNQLEAQVW